MLKSLVALTGTQNERVDDFSPDVGVPSLLLAWSGQLGNLEITVQPAPRRTEEMKVPCGTSCPVILISALPTWGLKVPSLLGRNWAEYTLPLCRLSPPERECDRG